MYIFRCNTTPVWKIISSIIYNEEDFVYGVNESETRKMRHRVAYLCLIDQNFTNV